jgi:hypothetical protein
LKRADYLPNLPKEDAVLTIKMLFESYLDNKVYENYTEKFNREPLKFDFNGFLSSCSERSLTSSSSIDFRGNK